MSISPFPVCMCVCVCVHVRLSLRPGLLITVVVNTSYSSEVQLSAASLEGGGSMTLSSWVEILTFSHKAIWK